MNELAIEALVDFASQAAHMRFNDTRLRVEVEAPDLLQEHGSRYDAGRLPHKVLEQLELKWRELDVCPSAPDFSPEKIHL